MKSKALVESPRAPEARLVGSEAHALVDELNGRIPPETAERTRLMISELVTNQHEERTSARERAELDVDEVLS